MKRSWMIGATVGVVFLLVGGGYLLAKYPATFKSFLSVQKFPQEGLINEQWLKNAAYPIGGDRISLKGDSIILKDGKEVVSVPSVDEDGSEYVRQEVRFVLTGYGIGDIDQSGNQDAVVYLTSGDGQEPGSFHIFVVLDDGDHPRIIHSRVPDLQVNEKVNAIQVRGGEVVFDMLVHGQWDLYTRPTHHLKQSYRYLDGELVLATPLVEEGLKGVPKVLEQAAYGLGSAGNELISPDGEWLLEGMKDVGQEPFSRGLEFYIQFTNLKGKGNRYVYLDWSERPEDHAYSNKDDVHPLGWAADGTAVYVGSFKPFNDGRKESLPALEHYWQPARSVYRYDLSGPTFNYGDRVRITPGGVSEYQAGATLDFLAKEDRALWFESSEDRSTNINDKENYQKRVSSRLIYFNPSSSNSTVIAEWPNGDTRAVTSGSLDRDRAILRAAYVVHQPGKNDEVYLYEASSTSPTVSTTTKIDVGAYRNVLTKQYGIQEPYELVMEHTAMNLPGGLFLVVIGANQKTVIMRFGLSNGVWTSYGISETGALL